MDATAATGCTERHLKLLQVVVLDALLKLTEEKVMGDHVLLGEAGSIDRFNAGQVCKVALVARRGGGERIVGELIVIAVVANGSRLRGIHLKVGLPRFVKKGILGGYTR